MAYEMRENSGTLFENDRKEKDNHPDMTGKALIAGVEYYMSAWKKEGRKAEFLSFAFKPVENKGKGPDVKKEDTSDIPF